MSEAIVATRATEPGARAVSRRWFWYTVATILLWGVWGILYKYISALMSEGQALFMFTLGAVATGFVVFLGGRFKVETSRPGIAYGIANGALSNVGNLAILGAFASDLSGNTAIIASVTGLYPVITIALAVVFLRERPTGVQSIGLVLVFLAILLFAQPPPSEPAVAATPDVASLPVVSAPVDPHFALLSVSVAKWPVYVFIALVSFGVVGLLQKLSTVYLSAESALIWLLVGFSFFIPIFYPGPDLFETPVAYLALAFVSGVFNVLAAWALLAALKSGGKVSVVIPCTALYPLLVVIAAPFIFHEPIRGLEIAAIMCAILATMLLSRS